MTDAAVAAPAAPEPSVATIEPQVTPPQPIESAGPEPKPEPKPEPELKSDKPEAPKPAEKPATVRDALKKADTEAKAKAEAKEKPAEPAKKPEAAKTEAKTEAPTRDETGKFVSKDPDKQAQQPKDAQTQPEMGKDTPRQSSAFHEPPARFKGDQAAATEWTNAPEAVRAATHRVVRELEQGIQKYKADADEYAELKDYRDLASKHGTTIRKALDNYVGIEQMLAKDPIGGLEKVVSNLGLKRQDGSPVTLRDIAGYILGQKPEDVASRQDAVIQGLRKEIDGLKQQLGGVSQHVETQQQQAVHGLISEFASQHPRFSELEADIEFFLTSGKVDQSLPVRERLSEAYKLAERLNPAPQQAFAPPAQTRTPTPQAEAQTLIDKGSKSVSGAPSGEEPARRPSSSIRESLRRAAQAAA